MNDTLRPSAASLLAAAYERDGFYFPYDVVGEEEAAGVVPAAMRT